MSLRLRHSSRHLGGRRWSWALWLSERTHGELAAVRSVLYSLDPTFPEPVREVEDPADGFRLEGTAASGFRAYATVEFRDGTVDVLDREVTVELPASGIDEPVQPASPVEPPHLSPSASGEADGYFEGFGLARASGFVGALTAAEEVGISRWTNVAGASGGAVVAALLAVGYRPSELRTILVDTDYTAFADYGRGGKFLGGIRNTLRTGALAHGAAFVDWLADRFAESPLGSAHPTFGDVERMDLSPPTADEVRPSRSRLRILASDVTEGRLLILPDDVVDFEDRDGVPYEPDALPIALAVRMSIGFPALFPPVDLYRNGRVHRIVDGCLLSNFPVFMFDSPQPKRPTWGFKIAAGSPPETPPYRVIPGGPLAQMNLMRAMLSSVMEADRGSAHSETARTVRIFAGALPPWKLALTPMEHQDIFEAGYRATELFFLQQRPYRNSFGVAPPVEIVTTSRSVDA